MTDTATYYYATDPTGSVSGLAEYDGTASVVNHYRYDVWGMPQGTVTEGVDNPIRFKARWWDEDTELLDFRNRWYDPEIGRFISEDPIGIAGGINVYRFVGNDPVSGWDPFGLFDPCPFPVAAESIPIIGPTIEMFNDITSLAQTGFPCGVELEPIQAEGSPGGGVYFDGPSGGLLLPGSNMSAPGGGGGNTTERPTPRECAWALTSVLDAVPFESGGEFAAAFYADAAAFGAQWQEAAYAPSTGRTVFARWLAFTNFTAGTVSTATAVGIWKAPLPFARLLTGPAEYLNAMAQSWAIHGDANYINLVAQSCAIF